MAYRDEVTADSPQRWWHLDDTSGTSAVESIGGNSGTYVNGPTFNVPGLAADAPRAVQFTAASTQEVSFPTTNLVPGGVGSFTLEVSFKWTAGTVLLRDHTSAGGSGWMAYDSAGTFTLRCGGVDMSTSLATSAVRDGNRHILHLVMVDLNSVIGYLDGVQIVTGNPGGSGTATPWHFAKNGSTTGNADAVGGDFVLYTTALSSTRVAAHTTAFFAASSPPVRPGRAHRGLVMRRARRSR